MNKEEIAKEDILNVTGSMFETMIDYVDNLNKELEQLQQQNKKYKEVIDKAIEYIWRTEINSIGTPLAYITIGKELLDILKEVE